MQEVTHTLRRATSGGPLEQATRVATLTTLLS